MANKKCDFCLNKLKASDGCFNVNEIVIDKNPGIIKLKDVLLDLFFCELDVSSICSECMDTVSKQFIFKQKIRKNIQMPASNVIVQISKFFSKTKETISSSEHLDVLSIFPERRKRFVETVRMFSPEICIQPPTIKEVLPTNSTEYIPNNTPKTIFKDSSETESNDSSLDVKKSGRKRKKKPVKARTKNSFKKQKSNSVDSIVKKEPATTESCEEQAKFEFFDCDQNDSKLRIHQSGTVLDSSGLNFGLMSEQEVWINETMEATERNGNYYSCKFCFKDLKSNLAMRYHYKNRHLLKKLTKKQVWVAHKIKEGLLQVNENGLIITKWKCSECSKIYNNQPGIRYHLTKHLKDDFDEVLEITSVKHE